MTLLVAITGWEVEPWLDRFRRLLPERRVVGLGDAYDLDEIRFAAAWRHPPGTFAGLPNLQAIFSLGAGVDHFLNDPALPDVPLARIVDDDLTRRMSEYVVLHCLMHLRQQRLYDRLQRERHWWDDRHQPSAADVRVGVMGLGVLGLDAARKLAAMGFDVAGWSRGPKTVDGLLAFAGAEGLDAFLARTDILVCLLPLTDETRGILDASFLRRLARDGRLGGPILVNAGRGGLQVEADILRCLEDGSLRAATLDVFEREPLPEDSPLWTHPAVTVTPHNASMSAPDAVGLQVAQGIRDMEAGLPLRHRVDRSRGY